MDVVVAKNGKRLATLPVLTTWLKKMIIDLKTNEKRRSTTEAGIQRYGSSTGAAGKKVKGGRNRPRRGKFAA